MPELDKEAPDRMGALKEVFVENNISYKLLSSGSLDVTSRQTLFGLGILRSQ